MSPGTEAIIQELREHSGQWVSGEALAHAVYGDDDCDAVRKSRLKQAIFYARRSLPAGLTIETGVGLGYRIIGAGAVE